LEYPGDDQHDGLLRSGSFYVEADLEAFEAGKRVFARSWNRRIPRQLG
jgi:hypothetical protein